MGFFDLGKKLTAALAVVSATTGAPKVGAQVVTFSATVTNVYFSEKEGVTLSVFIRTPDMTSVTNSTPGPWDGGTYKAPKSIGTFTVNVGDRQATYDITNIVIHIINSSEVITYPSDTPIVSGTISGKAPEWAPGMNCDGDEISLGVNLPIGTYNDVALTNIAYLNTPKNGSGCMGYGDGAYYKDASITTTLTYSDPDCRKVSIAKSGETIVLSWIPTTSSVNLLGATSPSGPWFTILTNAVPPATIPLGGAGSQYYRLGAK